jgi:hypothetical protein
MVLRRSHNAGDLVQGSRTLPHPSAQDGSTTAKSSLMGFYMGLFPFIILLVLITTVGKVLAERQSRIPPPSDRPQIGPGELNELRDSIDNLSNRLHQIEEERDFYKQLLDSPRRGDLPPGQ